LAALGTQPDTIDAGPAVSSQAPTIANPTKASSAPVIRHKRRRLTPVTGATVPCCAVCDSPAVPGEALCARHGEDAGLFD
jgi:hypothetical protein